MGSFEFEGRTVHVREGDTVASALYRDGVRTFTRSLKHHRRRGLYCLTGDCPNCMVSVDGEPGVRSCVTEAREGMRVRRETGWPSTERDLLSVTDHLHPLMPVGFYSKTFIRPRMAWSIAERVIRRATGFGRLPIRRPPRRVTVRHLRTDVLVIGGGPAGLSAAAAGADEGRSVVLCDEGRPGDKLPPGETLEHVRELEVELRAHPAVILLERHTAIGTYGGPLVPLAGENELVRVEPDRIVVATGATEKHGVFRGNDLPGVWLGRGAARMAGAHGVPPGSRAVVVATGEEGLEHMRTLDTAGVSVVMAVVPEALVGRVPGGTEAIAGGRIIAAEGRRHVRGVVVSTPGGDRRIACDALVLSLGSSPRDGLLRMGADLPVVGAGEVLLPGCTLQEAMQSGRLAGSERPQVQREPVAEPEGTAGYVCLCEDVSIGDLRKAWDEGWRSSEILKRYTTATMGPCQGAVCGRLLAAFAAARAQAPPAGARTTARPPARPIALETLAAGVDEVVDKRTALHDRHRELGAVLDRSGSWQRPYRYGDVAEEIRAVRERASVMDVSTLAKLLVAGRDATTLIDRVFPTRIVDLAPGRARYVVALDEAGYVMDDGLVCANADGSFYLTSTSGGAERMEAWLRDWTDRWDLHVHLVDQTAMLGAINVAGPRTRELLQRLTDDPLDRGTLRYPGHREIAVAGVPCRAVRVGFVGELSFELHHPRSRGVELWDALLEAGRDMDIRPHGLDALDVLRLEKGHPFLGQDTLPDDHPTKLGLAFAVAMDKPVFVGKVALERMASLPLERRLVGLGFDGTPQRGAPLLLHERVVGRVTSCARSRALGRDIGLGWIRAVEGRFPERLRTRGSTGTISATVVPTPFYDPEGARVRA